MSHHHTQSHIITPAYHTSNTLCHIIIIHSVTSSRTESHHHNTIPPTPCKRCARARCVKATRLQVSPFPSPSPSSLFLFPPPLLHQNPPKLNFELNFEFHSEFQRHPVRRKPQNSLNRSPTHSPYHDSPPPPQSHRRGGLGGGLVGARGGF